MRVGKGLRKVFFFSLVYLYFLNNIENEIKLKNFSMVPYSENKLPSSSGQMHKIPIQLLKKKKKTIQ